MTSSPYRYNKNIPERTPNSKSAQDFMLIQDGYCSPERPSYKDSSKQTPKSILKEYTNTSGSKSKKGIVINETLNETRKLSLKSENSEASGPRNNKKPQSATNTSLASFEAQIRSSNHKINENENNRYPSDGKGGFRSLWTAEAFNTGIRSDSSQPLSDFQKAYVKKLQRDREQEIYCEMVRKSNSSLNEGEKDQNDADNNETQNEYEDNRQLLRTIEQKRQSLDNGNSKRSQESLSSLGRVEEKIQQLEKCLDVYSNRLRDSIIRQRDQLIAGHYKKTEHVPETLPLRSWGDRRTSSNNQMSSKERTENKRNLSEYTKSKDYSANQTRSAYNSHWESLNNGLDQLKEENKSLRSEAPNQVAESFNTKKNDKIDATKLAASVYDKELELLKTVEEIRTKLYTSIAENSVHQITNRSKENTLSKSYYKTTKSKEAKGNNISKKKNSQIPLKYQKVRKAYGETTLERENADILNQGLSTVYNGFHWNADNSLKITRNV